MYINSGNGSKGSVEREKNMVLSAVCMLFGAVCFLYYLTLAVYAGPDFDFGWFWIMLGAMAVMIAVLGRFRGSEAAIWIRRILAAGLAAGLLLLCVMIGIVVQSMGRKTETGFDHVIVLGAQVRGTVPSRALRRRMERAVAAAAENPDAVLILSGGQGRGEDITEAECMRNYLVEAGVEEERMILEDRSTSTHENLLFSDRLTGCSKGKCGIISNDFHICRALLMAKKAGYTDVYGIPAPGDPVMEAHYIVREGAAILIAKIRGVI